MAAAVGGLTLIDGEASPPDAAPPSDVVPLSPPGQGSETTDPLTTAPTTAGPTTSASPAPPTTAPPATGDNRPVRVSVPAIGLDAPVIVLGLLSDQTLEVPATASDAGWWSGGSVPGSPGPAVIAGHVDLGGEDGVFSRLGSLNPGDEVTIALDRAQTVRYRVDRVERHAKDAFPTGAVYGPTTGPELRLITCGGAFDPSTGHYLDNVIVFATPLP